MNPSAVFASSSVAVRTSKNLITKNHIRNMLNALTATDAAKILEEIDYNREILATKPEDDDAIIASERERTVKTFRELCGDPALLYCVMAKYDYHNIKTLYMARGGKPHNSNETLYPFAVRTFDANRLPIPLRSAIRNTEAKSKVTAAEIDIAIDHALYQDITEHIAKIKTKSIADYFRTEIDIVNLRTFLKCRTLKTDAQDYFVKGGMLKPQALKQATSGDENAGEELRGTPYYKMALYPMDAFESSAADLLVKKSATDKNNINTLAPLFRWYVLKQEEFKAVKVLLMGKRLGFGKDKIRDNLGGLYDRFE